MQGFFRCDRIIDEQGNSPCLPEIVGMLLGGHSKAGRAAEKRMEGQLYEEIICRCFSSSSGAFDRSNRDICRCQGRGVPLRELRQRQSM